jgi:AhpD family alkylhydroperoxidase
MTGPIRYVTPVPKKSATGTVAAVYAQSTTGLGRLPEPYLILSPVPDLLTATWATIYESQLVGRASRASKEVVATAISVANRCPFCVDAHTIFTHATGEHRLADAVLRGEPPADPTHAKLVAWAIATRTCDAAELAAPPFPAELAAEYIGTALAFHFINRMVSALLPGGLPGLPTNPWLARLARRAGGLAFARAVRRQRRRGASLPLLPDAPGGALPAWAGDTPIGTAFAALRASAMTGGALLSDQARARILATVAGWDGAHPPMTSGWLQQPLAAVPAADRPGTRLALLAALAPYRITDAEVATWRSARHPTDADLVRLLAFGAISAVNHIEAAITAATTNIAPPAAT